MRRQKGCLERPLWKRVKTMPNGRRRALQSAAALVTLLASTMASRAAASPRLQQRFVPVPAREATPPPLALSDLDGRVHDLAAYRGRVVIVNFWATWCAPCLEELPTLQLLQGRLESAPVATLLVNYGESIERVESFVRSMDLDLPVLIDAFHRARHDWKVRALPTTFVVDPRGRLRYMVRGELDWAHQEVVTRIRALAR